MAQQHSGNTQPAIDQEEHEHSLQPATKRVLVYGYDGSAKQILKVNSDGELVVNVETGGMELGTYDYISYTSGSTTDVYVFKSGGSGGTTTATVTINWTNTDKNVLATDAVVKT